MPCIGIFFRHLRQTHQGEMRKVYQLYQSDQVSQDGFGKLYKPMEDQERDLASELPKLQGEIVAPEMQQLSANEIAAEATDFHKRWLSFKADEKPRIIESIDIQPTPLPRRSTQEATRSVAAVPS